MQILTPLLVAMRVRQLGRQFRDIERTIRGLPKRNRDRLIMLALREIGQAARCDFPYLYGTAPESRYLPWGQGTDHGYERARSNNTEVALRGMALWLAVAYHETRGASHAGLQLQHRHLLHLLRELKETDGSQGSVDCWIQDTAVA
ncbi:MAG: hypothetical protein ABI128_08490 [Rhodanobacter sp.]